MAGLRILFYVFRRCSRLYHLRVTVKEAAVNVEIQKKETRTEERILELQQGKRDLAGTIVSEDNASLATLQNTSSNCRPTSFR